MLHPASPTFSLPDTRGRPSIYLNVTLSPSFARSLSGSLSQAPTASTSTRFVLLPATQHRTITIHAGTSTTLVLKLRPAPSISPSSPSTRDKQNTIAIRSRYLNNTRFQTCAQLLLGLFRARQRRRNIARTIFSRYSSTPILSASPCLTHVFPLGHTQLAPHEARKQVP